MRRPPSRTTLHTVAAIYQTRTERAVCVRQVEDGPDIWLPRSEATIADGIGSMFAGIPPARGEVVAVTAPEWLLTEKGML